jgi:hypothetical protein
MNRAIVKLFAVSAVMLVCAQVTWAQAAFSYPELVNRLIDLEYLAVLPAKGESCKQWSSWDRTSKYDADEGKYIAWDANGDGSGIIRREGEQSVMAEMEGPGCIWRIWSARAQDGHVNKSVLS